MLRPEYLDRLPNRMVELYARVEADILCNMARRIAAFDDFIPAAQWQYQKLVEMGNLHQDIVKALSSMMGTTEKHLQELMTEAGMETLAFDDQVYTAAGLDPIPLAADPQLQAVLNDGLKATMGLFENLTKTTARTASGQFERALDRAWIQIQTGAFSTQQAINMAIKDLCKQGVGGKTGVPSIRYPSGHIDKLDVCVRRAVLTGVNQAALRLQMARLDEMGCDLVEVSAHAGARIGDGLENPGNHAWWQGKIYSRSGRSDKYPDFEECTGYGTGEGLGGWNCRHSFFPYIEGVSRPAYTDEELEELNAPKYPYRGKMLTEAEAVTKQRSFERQIRHWKREKAAMEAAGQDSSEAAAYLRRVSAKYRDFLDQTGLKRKYEREAVEKGQSEKTPPPLEAKQSQKQEREPASPPAPTPAPAPAPASSTVRTDVTAEYQKAATPGEGAVTYDEDYDQDQHQQESLVAKWLHDHFGGDIRLLQEANQDGVKTPDFQWKGKLWELKTPTTEKAANSAIRQGLKQIEKDPGGIILDYRGRQIDLELLASVIQKRLQWKPDRPSIDLIIILSDDNVKIWRYENSK